MKRIAALFVVSAAASPAADEFSYTEAHYQVMQADCDFATRCHAPLEKVACGSGLESAKKDRDNPQTKKLDASRKKIASADLDACTGWAKTADCSKYEGFLGWARSPGNKACGAYQDYLNLKGKYAR